MKIYFILFFILAACTHQPLQDSKPFFGPGNYRHFVKVEILKASRSAPSHLEFQGAVKITPNEIKLVALSSLGTTLFRISENRQTHQLENEFYDESTKSHESQVLRLYSLLSRALVANSGNNQIHSGDSQITFSNFDDRGMPRSLFIENPHLLIRIEVELVN